MYVPIVIFFSCTIFFFGVNKLLRFTVWKISLCRKLKLQAGIGIQALHHQCKGDGAHVGHYLKMKYDAFV